MAFQENLRKYRELAGYVQAKDFADVLGVKYTTYTAYENQGREPKFELLVKMATILGVTIDQLLGHATATPEESKQKKVLMLFKKAGFECELSESKVFLRYSVLTFDLPKEEFFEKAFEILNEGEQLSENYVLQKIKFFFSSSKNLKAFFEIP